VEELEIRGCHLREGDIVVEGRNGDVATVKDGRPRKVGVYAGAGVEAAEGGLTGGGRADGTGSETGTYRFEVGSNTFQELGWRWSLRATRSESKEYIPGL